MDHVVNSVSCSDCALTEQCLPLGLDVIEMDRLAGLIQHSRPLRRGEHLFSIGEPVRSLYAIRSGSVKVYIPTEGGEEQVLGFTLPGEVLGFDAFNDKHHTCSAILLETSTTCELPFEKLDELCHVLPRFNQQLYRLIGKEISNDHAMLLLLGKKTAEVRLASFLVSLSLRFKQRGFSDREFNLSMSRHDIGNYLGLAVETVSRLFARLQEDGILTVDRRYVKIVDIDRLRDLGGRNIRESIDTSAPEKLKQPA